MRLLDANLATGPKTWFRQMACDQLVLLNFEFGLAGSCHNEHAQCPDLRAVSSPSSV